MRKILCLVLLACSFCLPVAAGQPVTILVAAAASLQHSYVDELIPRFQAKYPHITVEGTYDSSGKLQAQIENGLGADVFMSAAMRQMNALNDKGFIASDTIVPLLENRIVLICPASSTTAVASFEQAGTVNVVAVGDPESVPAGQYAKEAFTNLGMWDAIAAKASFGTNVTEVLNWVAEGSADLGVVYATDAATTDRVKVIAQAPEGSLKNKVLYPVGMLAASENQPDAKLFIKFLQSDEALGVFEKYGFSSNK